MKKFLLIIIVCLIVPIATWSLGYAHSHLEPNPLEVRGYYISQLDLQVWENCDGNIQILSIGRVSPFRKYSWFRVGDMIEEVDGQRASISFLPSLDSDRETWIKFRRGDFSTNVQILLTLSVYGLPGWVNHQP